MSLASRKDAKIAKKGRKWGQKPRQLTAKRKTSNRRGRRDRRE